MAERPLVSIVTPVYNGERHLSQCIESVIAQTYDHWEYVVLDNASTDRTAEIALAYAEREPRIRYRRNAETLPIMDNWNAALAAISADSRYCKVVHADDLLLPQCVEQMVDAASAHPSAALVGAYRIDGQRVNMAALPYPETFVPGRELCRRRLLGLCRDPFGSPTSIMYRAADVRARPTFYRPDNPHADTEVCFDLLRGGDYAFVHQVLTYTRRHSGAETTQARRAGTHGVARLLIARDYGPDFLEPAEQSRAVDLQLRYHYGFLASNLGRLASDAAFRRYHLDIVRSCDGRLRAGRLALAAARVAVKKAERGAMLLARRATGGRQ